MRRTSFERESAFLGRDFSRVIQEVGGKAAGLQILQKALDTWGFWTFGIPEYVIIPPDFYLRVEERLHKGQAIDDLSLEAFNLCAQHFFGSREGDISEDTYHVRSSSQIEDFVDDRYFGTFQTIPFTNIFLRGFPSSLWRDFFEMKTRSKDRFGLPEDEALALIVMKSYGGYAHPDMKHVTIYSHYPEARNLGAVIELSEHIPHEHSHPLQLLFQRNSGKFFVHHAIDTDFTQYPPDSFEDFRKKVAATYGEKWVQRRPRIMKRLFQEMLEGDTSYISRERRESLEMYAKFPYHIGEEHTSISQERLQEIVAFSQRLEHALGYEVNLEAMVDKDSVYLVQCRPVPRLSEDRAVKRLGPLAKDRYLLAETPFVFGSFRHEGKLVYPKMKGPYPKHRFPEPVIVWNDNTWCKGIRYWDDDPLALAVLNPMEGTALTHGYNLIPPFGEMRDRFHFIGLPGYGEKFLSHMTDVRSERLYDGVYGPVHYTPYSLLIESDGRRGRVSVERQFAHLFT